MPFPAGQLPWPFTTNRIEVFVDLIVCSPTSIRKSTIGECRWAGDLSIGDSMPGMGSLASAAESC